MVLRIANVKLMLIVSVDVTDSLGVVKEGLLEVTIAEAWLARGATDHHFKLKCVCVSDHDAVVTGVRNYQHVIVDAFLSFNHKYLAWVS